MIILIVSYNISDIGLCSTFPFYEPLNIEKGVHCVVFDQLQNMVGEIKSTFESAMAALTLMQHDDKLLASRFDSSRTQQEERLADVLEMVLQLKVSEKYQLKVSG